MLQVQASAVLPKGLGDICFSSGSDPSHSVLWAVFQFCCDITADMRNCATATPTAKHTHSHSGDKEFHSAVQRYTVCPRQAPLPLLDVCRSTPSSAAQAVGPYETISRQDQRGLFDD